MRKNIDKPDMNLILECCHELGIKAVPAESSEYILLTDENGNVLKLDKQFNIFDDIAKKLEKESDMGRYDPYTDSFIKRR